MHRLSRSERPDCQAPLSTSPGPGRARGTPWGPHLVMGFSLLTAPLTTLLRRMPKSLSSAHEAFESLRTAFSTAPILRHPDPHVPFVVEVDASTTGVGAMLSQQYDEPPRLQPCAYYSKKLTPLIPSYLQELQGTRRHCVWSRSTVHLPCVESLLPPARSHGELVLRLPSTDKRPDWAEDPRTRTVPPGILSGRSVQLEPFPPVGRVCTEFPPSEHHGPYAVPVHTRLPTPALPVDGRAIGGSSCRPLVPGERESVGSAET